MSNKEIEKTLSEITDDMCESLDAIDCALKEIAEINAMFAPAPTPFYQYAE